MNTKILMIVSAIFLMILGVGFTFLPQEIAEYLNADTNPISLLFLQILGGLYLGFGLLNWMAKNSLMGGIYNRPLVTGNLVHFLVVALALIKHVGKYNANVFAIMLSLTVIYSIFAVSFGYVMMNNPKKLNPTD